jgi:hypothetical protein
MHPETRLSCQAGAKPVPVPHIAAPCLAFQSLRPSRTVSQQWTRAERRRRNDLPRGGGGRRDEKKSRADTAVDRPQQTKNTAAPGRREHMQRSAGCLTARKVRPPVRAHHPPLTDPQICKTVLGATSQALDDQRRRFPSQPRHRARLRDGQLSIRMERCSHAWSAAPMHGALLPWSAAPMERCSPRPLPAAVAATSCSCS